MSQIFVGDVVFWNSGLGLVDWCIRFKQTLKGRPVAAGVSAYKTRIHTEQHLCC